MSRQMVSIEGFWTGFLLYTKRAPSIGAITWAEMEAAHPGAAGRAVMAIWNSGRSKKVFWWCFFTTHKSEADFFSLDLADAAFFTADFAALAATFAVAADGLLLPP